jgi:hypothetical protein
VHPENSMPGWDEGGYDSDARVRVVDICWSTPSYSHGHDST